MLLLLQICWTLIFDFLYHMFQKTVSATVGMYMIVQHLLSSSLDYLFWLPVMQVAWSLAQVSHNYV